MLKSTIPVLLYLRRVSLRSDLVVASSMYGVTEITRREPANHFNCAKRHLHRILSSFLW